MYTFKILRESKYYVHFNLTVMDTPDNTVCNIDKNKQDGKWYLEWHYSEDDICLSDSYPKIADWLELEYEKVDHLK